MKPRVLHHRMKTDFDKLKQHLRPTTVAEVRAARADQDLTPDAHEDGFAYALELEMRADFWATAQSMGLETPWIDANRVAYELGVSRPYASMLMASGKLGEVRHEEGAAKQVRLGAVMAYRVQRDAAVAGSPSPRQAGVEMDLYGLSDDAVSEAMRRSR